MQVNDTSSMCSFFRAEAEGACTTQGELAGGGSGRAGSMPGCAAARHSPQLLTQPSPSLLPFPPPAGFLTVFMAMQCQKTCGLCTPDGGQAAPAAPPVELPPAPTCDKQPDTGSACPFFFQSMPNPCTAETAGDSFIKSYTQ